MNKKSRQNNNRKEERERPVGIIEKNKSGFGFVRQDEGGDIFIAAENMNSAMHGDEVSVDLLPEVFWGKNREGIVDRIIKRGNTHIVGVLQRSRNYGFVVPLDSKIGQDIFIKKQNLGPAVTGDVVMVKITSYPEKNKNPEGKIVEIISAKDEKGGEIKALYRARGYKREFPLKVKAEACKVSGNGVIDEKSTKGRKDLRGKTIITIDGADAKDLDDAISIERLENGNILLGVHIADVSEYVKDGTTLDEEALRRGTSVYLINTVIPMLPEELSNGICSLNRGESRLTLTCEMEIDSEGNIVNHSIYESVIATKERMNYKDVSDIIEFRDKRLMEKYSSITDDLLLMNETAEILRKKRKAGGSLDFDIDEANIRLDGDEVPVEISLRERRTGDRLIEEFMLAANKTVAEHFFWMDYPFVYRVHEKPDTEKLTELKAFLFGFGINLSGNPDNIHPAVINGILEEIKGEPYESIVASVILRSMKKAFYTPECEGHFGLACRYYCHFTSPIRRYPDLLVHRIVKSTLNGEADEEQIARFRECTIYASEHSSKAERDAQETERDAVKMKMAEYMEDHVGEVYEGVVSGVTNFGVYVQLPDTVEGMVSLGDIRDDFYVYEREKYRLIGSHTGRVISLGDRVKIKVVRANRMERQIDFVFV